MVHSITAVQVYGIILLLIGMAARYWVNRRRFNRRNAAGIYTFNNFEQKVALTFMEKLVKRVGLLFVIAGLLLIGIEWANHRFSERYKAEAHAKAVQQIR